MQERLIEELTKLLSKEMPSFGSELTEDVQQHVRLAVMTALQKMDVVTREEFDVQQAVLERSREKLEKLEAQLAELEKALQSK
jgi:BMFP domain-containing protein YqiC